MVMVVWVVTCLPDASVVVAVVVVVIVPGAGDGSAVLLLLFFFFLLYIIAVTDRIIIIAITARMSHSQTFCSAPFLGASGGCGCLWWFS